MTTSTLAFGKASASGALKQSVSKKVTYISKNYATGAATVPRPSKGTAHPKPADPTTQRELFMNVLNAHATKRDAKQYLARFKPPASKASPVLNPLQEERNARHQQDQDRLDRIGVNLGGLYTPARAIAESPQFIRDETEEKTASRRQELHVALVCLRSPETLDDATLDGVALTLSQLVKLDTQIVLVLDCHSPSTTSIRQIKQLFAEQADRVTEAIAHHNPRGAQVMNGAIEIYEGDIQEPNKTPAQETSVTVPRLLLDPLKRSKIPIMSSMAYTPSGQLVHCGASGIMSGLCSMLSGYENRNKANEYQHEAGSISLDRIIILDPAGGVPSKARGDSAHVFINLEQEFDDIQTELTQYERELDQDLQHNRQGSVYEKHRTNLDMARDCLMNLPPATSALIITPEEAASSSLSRSADDSTIGAGTRRQKNTLIHNLLTNKPMVSSSLPTARVRLSDEIATDAKSMVTPGATLVKLGMPLAIIPSAAQGLGWQPPADGRTSLDLEIDPRVDLPRLVHLIEESFGRKLDVRDYLTRIRGRIAGLIVAGEYAGGAILTWEQPPGTTDAARMVPYLDKFAVLKAFQGNAGVADIVFQAMVRTCFPQGVCWRSRKDNPVNKWYFERSDGTWQIPDSNWTMFWTGGGVVESEERWANYVGVCESVQPSWADNKKPD